MKRRLLPLLSLSGKPVLSRLFGWGIDPVLYRAAVLASDLGSHFAHKPTAGIHSKLRALDMLVIYGRDDSPRGILALDPIVTPIISNL
jgi:hypothetical protein